jgi:Fe-S-cluster containining protein
MNKGQREFECRRCGKCCKESWEISVDVEKDIFRWIEQKRFDILNKIVLNPRYLLAPERYNGEPPWIIDCGHVLFGDVGNKCPFLEEAVCEMPAGCSIHDTRPQVCRHFPHNPKNRVRSDILDVCVGTIFYHSSAAERMGLSFMEYMEQEYQKRADEPSPPRKDELKEIAHLFREGDLRVKFTSDIGMKLAEDLVQRIRLEPLNKLA